MTNSGCDVLLRCDGGAGIGLGHVKRCIALARALAKIGLAPSIAGRFDHAAQTVLAEARITPVHWPDGMREEEWLHLLHRRLTPRALVLDIRTALAPASVLEAKSHGVFTVVLDELSPRALAADLVVLPPTAQANDMRGFLGRVQIGWEWTILAEDPVRAKPDCASLGKPPLSLLVTMGGADPFGLTLRTASALRPLASQLHPIFVVGPAFADGEGAAAKLSQLWPKAEIVMRPRSLVSHMARCDLALATYGVTAQELAAAGVPALYLALSQDHLQSALALAATGAGRLLGRHDHCCDEDFVDSVQALIAGPSARAAMAAAGPRAIDGEGAARVAKLINIGIEATAKLRGSSRKPAPSLRANRGG